jgi:hypothetical protein
MVLSRRLEKLEAELDPESAVLHWLTVAHEYPTLAAYTDSWKDEPGSEHPLTRIAGQVETATRQRLRKEKRFGERAVDRAVHAAAFRVQLVVHLNLDAIDTVRVQGLLHVALTWRMRELSFRELLAAEDEAAAETDTLERDWSSWAEHTRDLIALLRAKRAARLELERRHLGGHGALFPETRDELRDLVERVEGLYETIAESGIAPAIEPLRTGPVDEGTGEHADRLGALASTAADAFMGWR